VDKPRGEEVDGQKEVTELVGALEVDSEC